MTLDKGLTFLYSDSMHLSQSPSFSLIRLTHCLQALHSIVFIVVVSDFVVYSSGWFITTLASLLCLVNLKKDTTEFAMAVLWPLLFRD